MHNSDRNGRPREGLVRRGLTSSSGSGALKKRRHVRSRSPIYSLFLRVLLFVLF